MWAGADPNQFQIQGHGGMPGVAVGGVYGQYGGLDWQASWPPVAQQPRMPKSPPGVSVFVGNLPPHITVDDLRSFVTHNVGALINIANVTIHRDKRFGFVTVDTPANADETAKRLNGLVVSDRKLRAEVTQHEPRAMGGAGAANPAAAAAAAVAAQRSAAVYGPGMQQFGGAMYAGHPGLLGFAPQDAAAFQRHDGYPRG